MAKKEKQAAPPKNYTGIEGLQPHDKVFDASDPKKTHVDVFVSPTHEKQKDEKPGKDVRADKFESTRVNALQEEKTRLEAELAELRAKVGINSIGPGSASEGGEKSDGKDKGKK